MKQGSTTSWQNLDTATRTPTGDGSGVDVRLPGLTVLAHPDVRRIGERSPLHPLSTGQDAALSRVEPIFTSLDDTRRRPLGDPHLSRKPLVFTTAPNGGLRLTRDRDYKGHVTVDGEPLDHGRDVSLAEIERGVVLGLAARVVLVLHFMEPLPPPELARFGLVGESAGISSVRRQIAKVADLEVPVLVRGETGTGKELVASALHQASRRAGQPFVAVNMGALPPTLAAAELFGAKKGAFTGADQKRDGHFVRAQGGTLFLDEVGGTPPEVQVMLLRTLETGLVQPLGAERPRRVDVRLVAATDARLEAEIEAGRFRAPLYHRLSGYEIRLPPLRERREDLGLLLVHFLGQELEAVGESWRLLERDAGAPPWLPASVVARLALFSWPGNVRQLRNVARQMVISSRGAAELKLPTQVEEMLGERPAPAAPAPPPVSDLRPSNLESGRAVVKTLLVTDLVDSTKLVETLGDARALTVMTRHDREARRLLAFYDGHEIDKADGFLMLFERPLDAVGYALEYHETLAALSEELGVELEARVGIHLGEVYLRRNDPAEVTRGAKALEVEGIAKPMAARLMHLAMGGQTLLTRGAFDLARRAIDGDHPLADSTVRWLRHDAYRFKGLAEPAEVFEVGVEGAAPLSPPRSSDKAWRGAAEDVPASSSAKPAYRSPGEVGEEELLAALLAHAFKIQPTAAALGVSRTSLYALIDASPRVKKPRDLSREEIVEAKERHGGDLDAMAAELEVSRKGLRRRMTALGFD